MQSAVKLWRNDPYNYRALFETSRDTVLEFYYRINDPAKIPPENTKFHALLAKYQRRVAGVYSDDESEESNSEEDEDQQDDSTESSDDDE